VHKKQSALLYGTVIYLNTFLGGRVWEFLTLLSKKIGMKFNVGFCSLSLYFIPELRGKYTDEDKHPGVLD
jgi:hypothetical protein